jgi:hypothetical protein
VNLTDYGVTIGNLTLARRVQGFVTKDGRNDGEPCLTLDLRAPYGVGGDGVEAARHDLGLTLADCASIFERGRQDSGQTHGGFFVGGVYPSGAHPAAGSRLLEEARRYIDAVTFGGSNTSPAEVTFEIGPDLPTQRVFLRSWGHFGITADTPVGRIKLLVDYPDFWVSENGKRPIDEIDGLLSAMLAWLQGARFTLASDFREKASQWLRPDMPMPEGWCNTEFNGNLYVPVGGGYTFLDANLTLSSAQAHVPAQDDVRCVIEEFRSRLIAEVPALYII